MSEANIPTQHESAVAVVRKQVCDLDAQIQVTARKLELETAQRDVLLDLEALLTRKPRARKTRATVEAPANDSAEENTPRPTVFATPSIEEAA